MNTIAFKIKKAAEKSVLQGHPWIYESSIVKQSGEGQWGDISVIFSQRRNSLLAIGLYDPESVIRIRVLEVGKAKIDKEYFAHKLGEAYKQRKPLLKTNTTAFRLCYGENDGLPGLIIDIYNDKAVFKIYTGVWFPYLSILTEIIRELLTINAVILRLNRLLQKADSPLHDGEIIYGDLPEEEVVFHEHDLKFKANLIHGHKTGYFLDHRHNRLKIRGLAKVKKVLDIFAYAGGFSVNALAGGASEVTSLDISAKALELAKENAHLNFDATNHHILAADAFEALRQFDKDKIVFDLIVCDPPSFAKSENQISLALKNYRLLVSLVCEVLDKGGLLLMASCSSRINKEAFYTLVTEEVEKTNRPFSVLEKTTHDVDHPEGIKEMSYLKSIYIQFRD